MKLYWKYLRYQWKTLLSGLMFSIFFGLGSVAITWFMITILYFWEYRRAVKELESDYKYQNLIKTISELKYEKKTKKHNKQNIWGEA